MIELVRRILAVFERHGLWDEGVELIGSWCFYLPYPYRGRAKVDLIDELKRLGFRNDFRPDGSIYLWNAELRIEFLIPERGRGRDKAVEIKPLAVKAMPLRFVDMLLRYPTFVTEGGITVSIPDPAAFCLNKLLVANRRRRAESRQKDLEQALHVAPIVKESTLKRIYQELPKTWQRALIQTMEKTVPSAVLLREEAQTLLDTLQRLK